MKNGMALACLTFGALIGAAQPAAAAPILNPANGHYYEVINTSINWANANTAAQALSFLGVQGHLVTITSAQENQWLTSTFGAGTLHYHWTGGIQPAGSTEPAGGWSWVTAEPFSFSNWWPGEPNNSGGNESRIVFDHGVTANGKSWNDLTATNNTNGYVVEYDVPAVPEPGTFAIFGMFLALGAGCWLVRRPRVEAASAAK